MQITIDLPDNPSLTEADLRAPSDPDDDPDELIFAHLRISLQAKEGNLKPISELWNEMDD